MEDIRNFVIGLINQGKNSDGFMLRTLNVGEKEQVSRLGMLSSPGKVFVAKAGVVAFKYNENLYLVQVSNDLTTYQAFALFSVLPNGDDV